MTGTGASAFWRAAEYAKSDPAWRYREIDTDHMIPINRPAEVGKELLLEPGRSEHQSPRGFGIGGPGGVPGLQLLEDCPPVRTAARAR